MKRVIFRAIAAAMILCMSLAIAACGKKEEKLVCGVTDFNPMNYKEDGKWVGFDTEFAELVADKLGMQVEFQLIEWGNKYFELESGAISCIWNGLTANTAEEIDGVEKDRSDWYDFSYSYMLNKQCVVIKADRADEFKNTDDLKGKKIAAEEGSAGDTVAKQVIGDGEFIGAAAQVTTFTEVKAGSVDCSIVDYLLAERLIGSGDFKDLKVVEIDFDATPEVYAIGFKKGSDLRDKVNEAIKELDEAGELKKLAEKYKIAGSLKIDTSFGE